jgi:transcriptional regulator with XRE-family HTH domain
MTGFAVWRARMGLTQEEVATLLNKHVRTIRRYETGERDMPDYLPILMTLAARGIDICCEPWPDDPLDARELYKEALAERAEGASPFGGESGPDRSGPDVAAPVHQGPERSCPPWKRWFGGRGSPRLWGSRQVAMAAAATKSVRKSPLPCGEDQPERPGRARAGG